MVKINQMKLLFSYIIIIIVIVFVTILTHYVEPGEFNEVELMGGEKYLYLPEDSNDKYSGYYLIHYEGEQLLLSPVYTERFKENQPEESLEREIFTLEQKTGFSNLEESGLKIHKFLADRTILIKDSFQTIKEMEGEDAAEEYEQGFLDALLSPILGLYRKIFFVVFIFVVGASFFMVQKTGVIDAGIHRMIERYRQRPSRFIPLLMIAFSLAGSLFGLLEEMVPMVLIFIPVALMLGYDSLVGFAIVIVGLGTGFAAAVFNPFTVVIAQDVAQVPIYSGMPFRFLCWAVFIGVAITYVMLYAKRIRNHPDKSAVRDIDIERSSEIEKFKETKMEFTPAHKRALVVIIITFSIIIVGVFAKWFLLTFFEYNLFFGTEIVALLFLIMGFLCGVVAGIKLKEIGKSFILGIWAFFPAIIIIGLSQGVLVVAEDGKIIHTILNDLDHMMEDIVAGYSAFMSKSISASTMFVIQGIINFFVPSGSAQAILTMPVMAPLADLLGVTRQVAVLAFQFGDGFSNIMHPTNGVLIISLAISSIPYTKWLRFVIPLQLLFFIFSVIMLVLAIAIGW